MALRPVVTVLGVLLYAATAVQTVRLTAFMVDDGLVEHSVLPFDSFAKNHSCLSAYAYAAALARRGERSLYDPRHYPREAGGKRVLDTGRFVQIDRYQYPPPFLLLPVGVLAASDGDFLVMRIFWFVLQAGLFVAALALLARFVGGAIGTRLLWLSPLVWIAVPTFMTFQMGNVHLFIVAAAVLAMVAFERGWHPVGGAFLAFAALTKVFPALLMLYLAAQRRWRSVAWTAGFGALFVAGAMALFGVEPFVAFVEEHLPRVASGEAFPRSAFAIAANHSAAGAVQKAMLLGAPLPEETERWATWVYAAAMAVLAVWMGRSAAAAVGRGEEVRWRAAVAWIAILSLGALTSPFAPYPYVVVPGIWIAVLLAARTPTVKWIALAAAAWVVLSVHLSTMMVDEEWAMGYSLFAQAAGVAVAVAAAWQARGPVAIGKPKQVGEPGAVG